MEAFGNEFMRRLRLVKKSRPEDVKRNLERLIQRSASLNRSRRSLRRAG